MAKSYLTRKEKIIINAIDILDQGGINGLTMKEIANQQGVTEPAVYRQFNNKKEIVLTILGRFAAFDENLMNTVSQQQMKPEEAIIYFFTSYATYYENYPQIVTALFSFDVYRYEPEANRRMKEIIQKRSSFVERLTQEGIELEIFSADQSAQIYAQMLLGLLWSSMYQWKMDECGWNLKNNMMEQLKWMLNCMKQSS